MISKNEFSNFATSWPRPVVPCDQLAATSSTLRPVGRDQCAATSWARPVGRDQLGATSCPRPVGRVPSCQHWCTKSIVILPIKAFKYFLSPLFFIFKVKIAKRSDGCFTFSFYLNIFIIDNWMQRKYVHNFFELHIILPK